MTAKSQKRLSKAYTEIEWPALYFKTFTCFPRLPAELRRKIWFHALPEPRFVRIGVDWALKDWRPPETLINISVWDCATTIHNGKSGGPRVNILQLFLTCHESQEVFLENYKCLDIQLPTDGQFLFAPRTTPTQTRLVHVKIKSRPSHRYIDRHIDTLRFDNIAETLTLLPISGIRLDLSPFTNIVVAGYDYSKHPQYSPIQLPESPWRLIEKNFPQLKSLTLIGNSSGFPAQLWNKKIPTTPRLHPLNQQTMDEVGRQMAFKDPVTWDRYTSPHIRAGIQLNELTRKKFLTETDANPRYWKGVEFAISQWLNHTVHNANDYIQLKPKRPIEGHRKRIYYTQAMCPSDIGSAFTAYDGYGCGIDCFADGTLFNFENSKLRSKLHESLDENGKKYSTWPWKSLPDKNCKYDGSRFKEILRLGYY